MNAFRLNDPGDPADSMPASLSARRYAADSKVTVMLFRASVVATCLWSLVESYWETAASETTTQLAALISAKVIVAILGAASMIRGGWPRISFARRLPRRGRLDATPRSMNGLPVFLFIH